MRRIIQVHFLFLSFLLVKAQDLVSSNSSLEELLNSTTPGPCPANLTAPGHSDNSSTTGPCSPNIRAPDFNDLVSSNSSLEELLNNSTTPGPCPANFTAPGHSDNSSTTGPCSPNIRAPDFNSTRRTGVEVYWNNNFDQPVDFTCPNSQSISAIMSEFNSHFKDRVWEFWCQDTFTKAPTCHKTNYVNNFDEVVDFTCPTNNVISGVYSYHDNYYEDRRWAFLCCAASNFCLGSCMWTNYVNDFHEVMTWYVPTGQYLAGTYSYHDNKKEDRRWKYLTCKKKAC
ncbi:hypothetical protein ACEWY4_009423 [Coilia grayii]|uniref:Uncharacterized protein n=1 Tax=Coilia grayii TaxID=363190 RepID=A0ABD1K6I5_9TELE